MAAEFFTLILIPDARSASRRIRIPVWAVRWTRPAAVAAAVAMGGLLIHYVWLNAHISQLDTLRSENAAMSEQARWYEDKFIEFSGQIAGLQRTVTKLGVISGVEQTLPEDNGVTGGVGGVSGFESVPPSHDRDLALQSLTLRLSDLAERSIRIERFYEDQQVRLSHTPSIWPVRGYLSSGFGTRRDPFTGRKDFHPGIDVSAPRGTKIVAPADGVVLSVGRRGAYGRAIIISHGYGVITRYGHLDGYNVRAGQRVRRGDVIGFIGNTGRSNAPHLHYEVWVNDKLQNPIHYILDEYRSFG
jgi:murein DD-endopeptidase MepM/ murein hydrolase activator NlpD